MLRYGYLETSLEPWVLLWGDKNDMAFLADWFRRFPSNETSGSLANLGCHAQTGETVTVSFREAGARGMTKVKGRKRAFHWEIDRDHADLFAELVETLATSGRGHQYLEHGSSDEITVNVSCCEYPDDFLIE